MIKNTDKLVEYAWLENQMMTFEQSIVHFRKYLQLMVLCLSIDRHLAKEDMKAFKATHNPMQFWTFEEGRLYDAMSSLRVDRK